VNILQISVNDFGGCAYYLAEAIKATFPDEHDSISVRGAQPSYIKYKVHSMAPQPDDLAGLWNWADVVHVHDVMPPLPARLPTKPTVITYHGSMYRRNPSVYNGLVQRFGWVGTVATIDLLAHGLEWMPDCRPDFGELAKNRRERRFIVAHAPTSRLVKDTNRVIESLQGQDGVTLDVIEWVDYETCLRRKSYASVYVDQFNLCYGLNAIEAWSMGMPVIANAGSDTKARIRQLVGALPFEETALDDLLEVVLALRDDTAYYREAAQRGRDCFERFHSPQAAAKAALGYYVRALEKGAPRGMPQMKTRQKPKHIRRNSLRSGARRPDQPQSVEQEWPAAGSGGMVVVRYTGANVGQQSVTGDITGQLYLYNGMDEHGRTFLMDSLDAAEIVKPRRRGKNAGGKGPGVTEFEVIG